LKEEGACTLRNTNSARIGPMTRSQGKQEGKEKMAKVVRNDGVMRN
jgi:hypothetical protein